MSDEDGKLSEDELRMERIRAALALLAMSTHEMAEAVAIIVKSDAEDDRDKQEDVVRLNREMRDYLRSQMGAVRGRTSDLIRLIEGLTEDNRGELRDE